ncbi:cysteine desulfurase [Sphingomonas kyeonggiensis]|uniref:Cysteine desulfurase n=1 Tax=Sphingomonas kyeonggiensis TaxID=1268553 RepID=A0A7W7NQQ2_9SPHN|nr:cysteine desulfurase family protein [Sphingomonas kyeonggiensis]MBB4837016.1 cysteine desulfurase [Sphingomonas kyeonggiensis]
MTAIYLDGHASTPIAPEALDAMCRQAGRPGNPHAAHAAGASAAAAVEHGRSLVAALICAEPTEIVLTSGATEANNLAILGFARALRQSGSKKTTIVTSAIDHPSVLGPAEHLKREGFRHVSVPVGRDGLIDRHAFASAVRDAAVVSIGLANGEIGTIQPIGELTEVAHAAGAVVHCDATQAAGRIPVDAFALDVDALSLSSHKMYGPPGIGALFVSSAAPVQPEPLFVGGGQERGRRPGTVPTMLVAGFGAAARLAAERLAQDAEHGERLRRSFLDALDRAATGWSLSLESGSRLPGSLNLRFEGVDGDSLVDQLAGTVDFATGSACASGKVEPSHVLRAIGLSEDEARCAIRLYFHRYLDEEAAVRAAVLLASAAKRFRLVAGEVVQ